MLFRSYPLFLPFPFLWSGFSDHTYITRFRAASLDVKNAVIGALKGAASEKETQPSGRELNISGGNNRIAGRDYNETKGR